MNKSLFFLISFISTITLLAQPANDYCSSATNLGTLASPGACGSSTVTLNGTTTTLLTTNVGSTPENPYTYQSGCSNTPANTVWYSFIAPTYGYGVNISVSGGTGTLTNPQITLWEGSCNNFTGLGCTSSGAAGAVSLTVASELVPGQTYYIMVSGADETQSGAFTLSVSAFQNCGDCLNASHLTVSPLPVNGSYTPGQTVSFCFHIDQWTQTNNNWLHGVQLYFGSGWNLASLTTTAPPTLMQTKANMTAEGLTGCPTTCGSWAFYSGGETSSIAANGSFPLGFYFDGTYENVSAHSINCQCELLDGNPGNNFGDGDSDNGAGGDGLVINPTAAQWNFCWTIQVNGGACNPGGNLSVTVTTTGDGESGAWSSPGCSGDPQVNFNALQACCPPSVAATTTINCNGASTGVLTATATTGSSGNQDPYIFNWTGPSGTIATNTVSSGTTNSISGLPAGIYTVVVTDKNLCAATTTLTVAQPTAITITLTPTSAGCTTGGVITTTASGGTPAYTYSWAGPSSYTSTTQSPSGLNAGTYTLTLTDSKSCTKTATVTVGQTGSVSAGITSSATTGCSSATTFTFTNSGTASVTYAWSYGDGTANGSGSPVTHSYTSAGTYVVTETVTSGVCTATTAVTVTVATTPTVTLSSATYTTCLNSPVSFSVSGANTYTWAPTTGMTGSTSATPTVTPTSTTTPVVYSVTGTIGSCTSVAKTITLTVNPKPTLTVTPSPATICIGASSTITATGASTYTWTPPTGGGLSGTTGSPVIATPTSSGALVYTVTATNVNTCTNTATASITVNTLPTLTVTPSPSGTVCSASSAVLTASGANTYTWGTGPTTSTVNITGVNTGTTTTTNTINVVGTNTANCVNNTTYTLTVSPTPTITLTSPTYTICSGSSTSFSVSSSANSGTGYVWTAPSGGSVTGGGTSNNPTITATNTTTTATALVYTVTGTIGSCTSVAKTITLTVNPKPTLTVTPSPATICIGASSTITATGASTYTWTPPTGGGLSGTTGSPVTATPTSSGALVYTVTATNANTCTNTATASITVNTLPTLTVTPSPSGTVCSASSAVLTASGANTYTWGTGPTTSTVNITGVNTGTTTTTNTINVVGTNTANCVNNTTYTLTVSPTPTITLTSPTYTICSGSSTSFSVSSGATTYVWTAPSGGSITGGGATNNPTITATNTTTTATALVYTVTGTIGSCTSVAKTVTLTVNPSPILTLLGGGSICNGGSTTLSASGAASYTWSPSIGLSTTSGSVTVANPVATTTYNVVGTTSLSCSSLTPASVVVNVSASPVLAPTAPSYTICNGSSVTIGATGVNSFTWTASPGTGNLNNIHAQYPVASPTTTTSYTITGTANGCGPSTPTTCIVYVNPTPTITIAPIGSNSVICNGGSVVITPTMSPGPGTYTLIPGNVTGASFTVSPSSSTTYTINGNNTATSCMNSVTNAETTTITVNPTPTITIASIGSNSVICNGVSVVITPTMSPGSGTYTLNPGNQMGTSFTVSPSSSITYTINGSNTATSCTNAAVNADITTIMVNPTPTITIASIGSNSVICNGVSVVITPTMSPGSGTYTLNPGNQMGTSFTVSPSSSTTYTINGSNTATSCMNAAANADTTTIMVNPTPTITIASIGSNSVICNGVSVVITPTMSPGSGTYTLNPGNQMGTSFTVSPSSSTTYTINGSNTATSCMNAAANADTTTIMVNPTPPLPVLTAPTTTNNSYCIGSPISLTANSGTYTTVWYKGDSIVYTGVGSTYTPVGLTAGTYTYSIIDSVKATGCVSALASANTVTLTLNVNSLPVIDTAGVSITQSNCSTPTGGINNVTIIGNPTYTYTWTNTYSTPTATNIVGTGVATSSTTPANLSNVPSGSYYLYVTDINGCASTFSYVPVSDAGAPATPTLSTSGNTTTYCQGQTILPLIVNVVNSGTTTPTVNWSSSNTGSPILTGGANTNTYTPSSIPTGVPTTIYAIAVVNGCSSSPLPVTITINPAPSPPVLTNTAIPPYIECQGANPPIVLNVGATPSVTTIWSIGTSTVATGSSYTPGVLTPTTTVYTISDSSTVTGCTNLTAGNTLTVSVQINPAPSPPVLTNTAIPPYIECQGANPPIVLNVGATPSVTTIWSIGTSTVAMGSSYTPGVLTPTTTVYTISDSSTVTGCTNLTAGNTLTVSVQINPAPSPPVLTNTAIPPYIECQGANPPIVLNVGATPSVTTIWSIGTSTVATGSSYTPDVLTPTTTVYTISDSSTVTGCTNLTAGNTLTVSVQINPAPSPPVLTNTAIPPYIECQGANPPIVLNVGATPSVTTIWSIGTSTVAMGSSYTPGVLTPTTTVYTISDSSTVTGCTNLTAGNTLTVSVQINPAPSPPVLTNTAIPPYIECQGANPPIVLNVGATPSVTTIWSIGTSTVATGSSYTPDVLTPTTTVYTISDSSTVTGCTNLIAGNPLTITVTIEAAPTLTVSPSNTYTMCNGLSQILTVSGAGGSGSYTWTPSATLTGANTANPTASPSTGVTVYTVTGSNGTCSNSIPTTVTFTVFSTPILDTIGSSISPATCSKPTGGIGGVTIQAGTGTPQYHYQWYDGGVKIPGDTNLTLSNMPAGTYSLQVTDAHGCIAGEAGGVTTFSVPSSTGVVASFSASTTTSSVSIVVASSSTPATAGSITGNIPLGISFTNASTVGSLYTWTFGDGSPDSLSLNTSHSYTAAGTYTVMLLATSSGGCKDSAFVIVIADVPTMIIIPNIFSPNGDGINDEFFIINTGMSSLNCNIFNRWGQLLFAITAPNQSWDGRTPNGDNAPEGTYMYILQAQGLDGKTYKQDGTVTLVR